MVRREGPHRSSDSNNQMCQVLGNANTDQESLYRALVAFGNVVSGFPPIAYEASYTVLQVSSSAKPKLGKATASWLRLSSTTAKRSGEKRTKDLVDEVQSLIL